jgi:hypothetical protein
MNNDNDEVQHIIHQLKSLQIQQTALILRLERARDRETRTGSDHEARTNVAETRASIVANVVEPREFVIGDRVRIKNPNLFQTDRGTITKIGASRITVRTRSGTKIIRAPKNLIIEDGQRE